MEKIVSLKIPVSRLNIINDDIVQIELTQEETEELKSRLDNDAK